MFITMNHDAEMRSMKGADQIMSFGGEHARLASNAYQKASDDYILSLPLWLQPPNESIHYRDLIFTEFHRETVFDS